MLYICLAAGSVYILYFDNQDGKASVNNVIANEVNAKNYLKLIYGAQKQYVAVDWDKDGVKSYAEFIAHLWQTVDHNADPVRNSLIPRKIAFAMGVSRAIDGYYFQSIHTKEIQPGSPDSAIKNRHQPQQSIAIDLTHEWVVVATPASYGRTGTLSFITGSSGKIYAKDTRNRPVESIPDSLVPTGWQEITDELDIRKLHLERMKPKPGPLGLASLQAAKY
ncbi:hypothetical protein D1AOALGA4SA_3573 [Olavius algarvensis Delta 1 endosymbiont]|nr:hypothetical protein D1AOALGA4SA_3573 [Olavius algarvensis Delta 1 endosymbiont]